MTLTATHIFLIFLTLLIIMVTSIQSSNYVNNKFEQGIGSSASFNYQDQKMRGIPTVSKRAALLLDRLMVALQKAVENDVSRESDNGQTYSWSSPHLQEDTLTYPIGDAKTMDLQRRGQTKGRIYWRCYFNAVSCFK